MNLYRRKNSLRLKEYDYAAPGLYFITICTKSRVCLFGDIIEDRMLLHAAGQYANTCWLEIPCHFPNALLHEYIVMPNHVHGILELRKLPAEDQVQKNHFQHMIPRSVSAIVKGFKIGVTKWFRYGPDLSVVAENFQPLLKDHSSAPGNELFPVWQRSFHDHIIRTEEEYHRIKMYILRNPQNWNKDKFYKK